MLEKANQKIKNKNVQRKNKGITLIALVITIIVLLILAGVSINILIGENGLLTKSQDAADENTKGGARDKVATSVYASYNTDYNPDDLKLKINEEALKTNIEKAGGKIVSPGGFPVTVEMDGYEFWIYEYGDIATRTLLGDYVKEGLELHYDAVKNTKNGHDKNADTWYDLSGNSNNGKLNNGVKWTEDGLYFNGKDGWVGINGMNYDNITMEVVISFNKDKSATECILGNWNSGGSGLRTSDDGELCCYEAYIKGYGYNSAMNTTNIEKNKKYALSGRYDGKELSLFVNKLKEINKVEGQGKIGVPSLGTIMALGTNPLGSNKTQRRFFRAEQSIPLEYTVEH